MGLFAVILILHHACLTLAQMSINTPQGAVACQPYLVTWSGGIGPFVLQVLPGGDPTGAALETFTGIAGSPYTWNVLESAGATYSLQLRDSTGIIAETGIFTIQSGTSNCGTNPTTAAAPSPSPSPSPSSTPTPTPSPSTLTSSPLPSSPLSSPSSSPSSPLPSSTPPSHSSLTSTSKTQPSAISDIPSTSKSKVGVIVGPVVAVVAISVVITIRILYLRRRNRARKADVNTAHATLNPIGGVSMPTNPSLMIPGSYTTPFNYYSTTPAPFISTLSSSPSHNTSSMPTTSEAQNLPAPWLLGTNSLPPPSFSLPPPSFVSNTLPAYQFPSATDRAQTPYTIPLFGEHSQNQDDEIGKFAASHRDIIPYDLEEKLRRARYVPRDNPREIPASVWASEYGVGYFELKRLQELHEKLFPTEKNDKS